MEEIETLRLRVVELENELADLRMKMTATHFEWTGPDGMRHREDGPAVIYADGTRSWWKRGKMHRDGGPAIEWPNGDWDWYREGFLHREDGPAKTNQDGSFWYLHGNLHREDGPACEFKSGECRYYWRGKEIKVRSREAFLRRVKVLQIEEVHAG